MFHQPSIMEFGRLTLCSPDGSHRITPELWPELAMAVLTDPEPDLRDRWARRLEARLGVTDVHRRALARLEAQAWPGDEPRRGHRLNEAVTEEDELLDWFVLRTATRREAAAEETILEAGFTVYAPRMARYDRRQGRRIRVERPLVPGYLFVGLPGPDHLEEMGELDGVHDVMRALDGSGRPVVLSLDDVRPILQQDLDGEFDRTRRSRGDPAPNAPVNIAGGQFKGFPARFVERRPNERVKVMIQMFGRLSPLVLRADEVEELAEEPPA